MSLTIHHVETLNLTLYTGTSTEMAKAQEFVGSLSRGRVGMGAALTAPLLNPGSTVCSHCGGAAGWDHTSEDGSSRWTECPECYGTGRGHC